jgi:hypothetical protein
MGPWWWYKQKEEWVAQMWKCSKCRKAEMCILRKGAKQDFPWCATVPKAEALVMPRTSHAVEVRVECLSSVIYQNVYLIRLINVSTFLSD